ncbi:MAG TPA: M28 family peptidase [Acetobacteraceae bacterium]|nr:M28 family peptidase [Acetobacteraceae bacterium]
MSDAELRAVCDGVDGAVLMRHMQEFARWVKLSGTPDELQSLRYVQAELDSYGFSTDLLLHDAYISLPGRSRVEIDGATPRSITHSFSRSSPPDGVTAEVVYVGDGSPGDFSGKDVRGRIVLVEGIASPAVAHRASVAGAVGQLHISPHEHIHEMCVSPVWGSPSEETRRSLPSTVVTTVAYADGVALRDRLSSGTHPRVTLHAEVDTGWRKTPILVAELDAGSADAEPPFVMFSGHHDTWYYGVMDNGGANATMLEVARVCAARRGQWQRGLRLCFWSGHSHGRYSGSAWYADEYWEELERRCFAHVNVDSTGGVGATVLSNAASMAELAPLASEAVHMQAAAEYVGRPMDRSSDQSFWGIGLPSMLGSLSEQPPGPVKLRNKLGWWWHTPEDTLDKIDPANLVRDTRVFVHVLWRLLTDRVVPLDYSAWADKLSGELEGIGKAVGDRMALGPLVASAGSVGRAAGALGRVEPTRANRALMQVSRVLVPLHTGAAGRFAHDAALPQAPWPAVAALREFAAAAPGSDEALFAAVSARRGRNRLLHALHQAERVLQTVLVG